ncbi:hypothetical protein B0H12DRAFT_1082922 [Mycena haematopus]|nr:hypothetical protein B0H12DRAFT_1082922 [Mycena haematopus]
MPSIFKIVCWLLIISVSLPSFKQQLKSAIAALATPLCAAPVLRDSDVCRAVQSSLTRHWCSATPFISGTNWCQNIELTNTESGVKVEMFTPAVIINIHELLMAFDDLALMVEESGLNKTSSPLRIVASATFTLSIMEPPGWFPRRNQAEAKLAFHRALGTFDLYIHDLVTEQEIAHLVGIWSYLRGNRSLLADAQARLKILIAARIRTKTIHKMIWDAQAHLKELEINTQILRTFASASGIIGDGSREAMHGLSTGCRSIQDIMGRASGQTM